MSRDSRETVKTDNLDAVDVTELQTTGLMTCILTILRCPVPPVNLPTAMSLFNKCQLKQCLGVL